MLFKKDKEKAVKKEMENFENAMGNFRKEIYGADVAVEESLAEEVKELKKIYKSFTKSFKKDTKKQLLILNSGAEADNFATGIYNLLQYMKKYDMQLPVFPQDTLERIRNNDNLVWMDLAKLMIDSVPKDELESKKDLNFSMIYQITAMYLRRHEYALKIWELTEEECKDKTSLLMGTFQLFSDIESGNAERFNIIDNDWETFERLMWTANDYQRTREEKKGKTGKEIQYLFSDDFYITHRMKNTVIFKL